MDCSLAERRLGPLAHTGREVALEALCLLDVKALEVASFGVGFEQAEGLRDSIDRRFA